MEEKIKTRVIEWLLNGVTYLEIQQRLSWLGIVVTIKEIQIIQEEMSLLEKTTQKTKDLNSPLHLRKCKEEKKDDK